MKQAVKITVETNEIQEALQQEIRAMVKHELRDAIRKTVIELLPEESKAKLEPKAVQELVEFQTRTSLGNFDRQYGLGRIVKEEIKERVTNLASIQLADHLSELLKGRVESLMVDYAWNRIVKRADQYVENTVKELVEKHVQAKIDSLFKK